MCRMIAKISSKPATILAEMLQCPYSLQYLSGQGRQPSDPDFRGSHRDGCGLAFASNGNIQVHKRSKQDAWDSSYIDVVRNATSNIFIAHNRLASQGLLADERGAHPFTLNAAGKSWALCHNGGIRTYMEEAISQRTSDSFLFLKKLIHEDGENSVHEIRQRLAAISAETSYSSLCAFLMTNDALYAWRIYEPSDAETASRYESYYTMYMTVRGEGVVLASEPLDEGSWMLLENGTFLALRTGRESIDISFHGF